METDTKDLMNQLKNEKKPHLGKYYWVQCDGFRTLAVMRTDGKWKTFHNEEELSGVTKFYAQT